MRGLGSELAQTRQMADFVYKTSTTIVIREDSLTQNLSSNFSSIKEISESDTSDNDTNSTDSLSPSSSSPVSSIASQDYLT